MEAVSVFSMGSWGVLVLLLSWATYLAGQNAPPNTVFYQCNKTSISVAVKSDPLNNKMVLDPGSLTLGKCPVSSTTALYGFLVFEYSLYVCGFSRMASGNIVTFSTELVYRPNAAPNVFSLPFQQKITCVSDISLNPTPIETTVMVQVFGSGQLDFSFQFMNDDFTAPSDVKQFFLGAPIFLSISVNTGNHLPLQLFVDECIVAPTEVLSGSKQYVLINNHGCFVDGKVAASRFVEPSLLDTVKLTFPAMKFAGANDKCASATTAARLQDSPNHGNQQCLMYILLPSLAGFNYNTLIYIHFKLIVWDPKTVNGLKMCSYLSDVDRWQLLGNQQSDLCSCCDSICRRSFRRRRDAADTSDYGIIHTMVLGPFKVISPPFVNGSSNSGNDSKALETPSVFPIPPAVGALFLELTVLLLLSLGVAVYGRAAKQDYEELEKNLLVTDEN